jgi:endonuclease YncB( thermonuclease family)
VYVERDGQLINVSLWLVEQGWAVAFRSKSYTTVDTDKAKLLMEDAQAARRGVWATCPVRDVLPR